MNDDRDLKEQLNILFEDLDQEAKAEAPKPENGDEKVKEFFSDAFNDRKEKEEEFHFDRFEDEEETEHVKPVRPAEPKAEPAEEEETRRKIYEMGRDEEEEFPSFDPSEKGKKKAAAPSLQAESKRFWIFTAIIAVLTVAAILFILFSRGIFGGGSSKPNPTVPSTGEVLPSDSEEATGDSESDVPSSEEVPESTEPSSEEIEVPEDLGLAEVLKKYPNLFMVNSTKVEKELRVRSDPSIGENVIAKLSKYAGGNLISEENGWLKIESGGYTGYVSAEYCLTGNAAKAAAVPYITKKVEVLETARIREGADKADSGQRAGSGDQYEYLGEEGDYYKINFGGTEKFIAKSVSQLRCTIEEASEP